MLENNGATRRDRTGDLLITNFLVWAYAIDSVFGLRCGRLVYSAWRALVEPDSEPKFDMQSVAPFLASNGDNAGRVH